MLCTMSQALLVASQLIPYLTPYTLNPIPHNLTSGAHFCRCLPPERGPQPPQPGNCCTWRWYWSHPPCLGCGCGVVRNSGCSEQAATWEYGLHTRNGAFTLHSAAAKGNGHHYRLDRRDLQLGRPITPTLDNAKLRT